MWITFYFRNLRFCDIYSLYLFMIISNCPNDRTLCPLLLISYWNDIGIIFYYFTHYHYFLLFLFMCLSDSDSPIAFLSASIVCVNNLKSTADLVLWFPDKTSNYTTVHNLGTKMTLLYSPVKPFYNTIQGLLDIREQYLHSDSEIGYTLQQYRSA